MSENMRDILISVHSVILFCFGVIIMFGVMNFVVYMLS